MKPWEIRKRARKAVGLTQLQVAELFPGMSRVAVGQWEASPEKHGTSPDAKKLPALVRAYGLSTGQLLGHEPVDESTFNKAEYQLGQDIKKTLSANMLKYRGQRGMNQSELAKKSGTVSKHTISKIENMEVAATIDDIGAIAQALGISA